MRKKYKPEEIVSKLRQVDVLLSQGKSALEALRVIGVMEVTYYRWRREYGGAPPHDRIAAQSPRSIAA